MDATTLLIAFSAALAGAAIATWTGFGAATILTPVLALFLELHQAVLVVAIYHGVHNLIKILVFRQGVVVRIALLFGCAAVIASLVGGLLSAMTHVSFLKIILGSFLIFDSVTSFRRTSTDRNARPGSLRALIGGALSGFAAGIVGTGGAVRALFLHH